MATVAITASRPLPRPPLFPALALAVSGLLVLGGVAAYWRGWANHAPIGYGADLPALLATEAFALSATGVGFVVARRRPGSAVAWLLMLLGISAAAVTCGLFADAVAAGARIGGHPLGAPVPPQLSPAGWLAGSGMQPLMGGLTGALMFLFPDGRLPSRRWAPAVAVLLAGATLRFAEIALTGQPVPYLPTLENPFRAPGIAGEALAVARGANLGLYLLLTGMVLGAGSLVARYRRACDTVRRQVRGFVFAGTLVALTLVPLAHLFVFVDPRDGRGQDLWVAFFAAASLFPAAVWAAITRYRLYEIDRLISRTFVYGTLTAVVAGVFTASVGLSQRLFVTLTGETSDLAIVLTTLVAAATYTPVRRRLEKLAERLFGYEEPRFGAYRKSLGDVLGLLDPEAACQRLVDEATHELHAAGGWVELDDPDVALGGLSREAPCDPCPPVLSVPIPGRGRSHGRLVLGPRLDGSPYRDGDVAALEDVARLVGRALDLQRPGSPGSGSGSAPGRRPRIAGGTTRREAASELRAAPRRPTRTSSSTSRGPMMEPAGAA